MNSPRIIFMGTPDFAVASLKAIIDNNLNVVGVITSVDKPAGRGRKTNTSAVKKYAEKQGLNILQPTNLKDETFISELKKLNADLQIVVAFRMLPKVVWGMPKLGTFNLHASLLPQYRGAAPINWAVINGETKTGVTTFLLNSEIDKGNILLQKEISISNNDNAGVVHDKLMDIGANLVLETIEYLGTNNLVEKEQHESEELKIAPKIFKENCKINWNKDVQIVCNFIRGLSPYPGAWSTLHNNGINIEMKILNARINSEKHYQELGKVITTNKSMLISAENGVIEILEMQISGKKRMKTSDFLNGFTFYEDAIML